jgi:hypothetical protein
VRPTRALAALCAIAALAGCGGSGDDGGGSGGGSAPSADDSALTKAAPFVGDGAAAVEFVDWAAVKKTLGGDVGGTRLVRVSDIGPLNTRTPPGVPGPLGFNFDDLEWEARVDGAATLNLVGFPEDFDLAAVERRLERCGYERSEVEGGALYSRERLRTCEGDDDPTGVLTPEPRLSNVALLDDDRLLVAASSAEEVERAVESRGDGDDFESALEDLGSTLDGVVAGYVGSGAFGCKQFAPDAGAPGRLTPEVERELKRRQGDLGEPYELLMVGFVPDGDRFDGRVVLDYEDGDPAEDELDSRRRSFEETTSPVTAEPLSADLRLTSAEVEDDAIVFSLAPREGPLQLFGRVVKRDLPFAGC